MIMQVETFEQTEVVGGKLEAETSTEAFELIAQLGLSGQEKLLSKGEGGVTTRSPYRVMTKTEFRVYECLYPDKVELAQYHASMIPLRVLQVAAHAKSLNIYKGIYVWCELGRPTDPVLVGEFVPDPVYPHSTVSHILARWGDALESFDVLYEKAKKKTMDKMRLDMEEVKRRASAIEGSLEFHAVKYLSGEWVHLPA